MAWKTWKRSWMSLVLALPPCATAQEDLDLTPQWNWDESSLELSWTSEAGKSYELEGSINLQDWRSIDSYPGFGAPLIVKTSSLNASTDRFFRVRTSEVTDPPEIVDLFDPVRDGYAAVLTDVPPARQAGNDELLDGIIARLDAGETFDQIEAWLRGLPDMKKVYRSPLTIILQPHDSPPMVVHDGAKARCPGKPQILSRTRSAKPKFVDISEYPSVGQLIIGKDRDGDMRRDFEKRTLIMSPFASDFTPYNPSLAFTRFAPDTIELLNDHLDIYEDDLVKLNDFTNWDDYDLIHVSTHGDRILLPMEDGRLGLMEVMFVKKETKGSLHSYLSADGNEHLDTEGLYNGIVTLPDEKATRATLITPRWMQEQGNIQLERKVIFLDVCHSGHGEFMDFLAGTHSATVGWNGYVQAGHAFTFSYLLYHHTLEHRLPLKRSFELICEGFNCRDPKNKSKPVINLNGADLRLTEMISIVDPLTGATSYDPNILLERSTTWCEDVVEAFRLIGADPSLLNTTVAPIIEIRGLEDANLKNHGPDVASTLKYSYLFDTRLDGTSKGEILMAEPGLIKVPDVPYSYRYEVATPGISLEQNLLLGEQYELLFSLRMPPAEVEPGKAGGMMFSGFSYALPTNKVVVTSCCDGEDCQLPGFGGNPAP